MINRFNVLPVRVKDKRGIVARVILRSVAGRTVILAFTHLRVYPPSQYNVLPVIFLFSSKNRAASACSSTVPGRCTRVTLFQ